LRPVIERLPDGMQTQLGEGGGLVSGGEGQRVRLGRALMREPARLAILDEPFRGLDRARRRELLASARDHWRTATLLCVTHDVGETRDFDRVLVIADGRIVEDGQPDELYSRADSRYRRLVDADAALARGVWGTGWRHLWLDRGVLREQSTDEDNEDRTEAER
ncbi:MAG: ABC transporter permease, partial [Myxococcota bacterium]